MGCLIAAQAYCIAVVHPECDKSIFFPEVLLFLAKMGEYPNKSCWEA